MSCLKGVAIATADYNICKSFDINKYPAVKGEQAECFYKTAVNNVDINGCKLITNDNEIFNWCVNEIVAKTNNKEYCNILDKSSDRDRCISGTGYVRQSLPSPDSSNY